VTDRERISRLEALLARVKARTDEPRANLDSENGESYEEAELIEEPTDDVAAPAVQASDFADSPDAEANGWGRADSVFPAESSTLQALPPPPPNSSASAFAAPDSTPASRPISQPVSQPIAKADAPALPNSSPASLEEAFEQYEMVSEVVEVTPDAEDDSVRPSIPAPIMSDDAFADDQREPVPRGDGQLRVETPVEEFQSQQRLVVAPSTRPVSGVDEGELEILGESDLDSEDQVMDVETDDLLARTSEVDVPSGRPTRQAEEMIATILSTGLDAPPENANRPVLELQEEDDIEEPPPSSRRPVSHEEVHEQELTFENDPPPLMTPPPESGRQVALPDLSLSNLSGTFDADFSGVSKDSADDPAVVRAPLAENSGVAVMVAPSAPRAAATFGELIDLALSI
jgi:hypothetical protein